MVITILMWGCSFVATKILLRELSPVPVIICRFALGNAFLLLVLAVRGDNPWPARENWPSLALMGLVGVFVHQLLQVVGLNLTSVANTGWLIALIPLWSALFS